MGRLTDGGKRHMAKEPRIRPVVLDPATMNWALPAEALHRLDALARLAGTDPLGSGRPLPARHRQNILAALLAHLLPDGTEEFRPEAFQTLDLRQREYLANLIHRARADLRTRQAEAPATLLGFPPDRHATWANLLDRGWIPMQPGWKAVLRRKP